MQFIFCTVLQTSQKLQVAHELIINKNTSILNKKELRMKEKEEIMKYDLN